MPTRLNPYLSFRDTARQAMEFYRDVFGGELTLSTFGEMQMAQDPAEAEKIMHGMLVTPGGLVLMGADTPNAMELTKGSDHALSLSGEDEGELRGYWDRLCDGGTRGAPSRAGAVGRCVRDVHGSLRHTVDGQHQRFW